jgi:cytidylate kinase
MGQAGSVVMEGRDIGSVVFPEAEVKIYLDADSQVRAGRRALELDRPASDVAREIADRDLRDRARKDSPLLQSPDAVYVDTSGLDLDQVEELVLKLIRERTSNGKEYSR